MIAGLRSIKTKVTLIVTACIAGLLVLVSAIEMYRVKTDLREVLGQQQLTLVSRMADELDEKLKSTQAALIAASRVIPLETAGDPERLRRNLEDRPGILSLFDGLFVFSRKGTILVDVPAIDVSGNSVADREYFQRTLAERRPLISPPFIGRTVKQPVIMLTAPILDDRGEVAAILAGTLNLMRPNFLGNISTASVGKTGQFALLGRDRTIFVSRDAERTMTQGPAPGVSPYFDRATSGEEGWEENVNSRGLRALYSYSQLETAPWVLVAALPIAEAYAPIVAAQERIVQTTIVLIVLLAPLVWFGTGYMIRPLLLLRDAIRRVRSDPGSTPEVAVRRRDEIGDLAADFNALMRERDESGVASQESARRLRAIADHTPALISYIDSGERYRYANASYSEWFGMAPEVVQGRTVPEVVGKEGYALREPYIREALAGKEVSVDLPVSKFGGEGYTHIRYVPDFRGDGSVAGFYVLATDVTELKRTERMLRESERQLSLALEGSRLALFDWNVVTGDVYLSEHWAELIQGKSAPTHTTFAALGELVHPDDRDHLGRLIREALKGENSHYRAEHRVRAHTGQWIWIQSNGQVTTRGLDGKALRLVGTNADVTERKRAEHELAESRAALERAARHDVLTGLPNRSLLGDRLDQALARARRTGQLTSLFCLDLDHFKSINDTMGHAAGDALLVAFAERLNACVRESDTVARLGGDEFVILLQELRRPEDAHAVSRKIIETMRRDFHIESKRFQVTTSIGIAFTRGAATSQSFLKRADAALYEAKGAGRNRFHVALPEEKEPPATTRAARTK